MRTEGMEQYIANNTVHHAEARLLHMPTRCRSSAGVTDNNNNKH